MRETFKTHFFFLFFAISACSWVPHWACHYYRLETGTSFVVGSWSYSPAESAVSLVVYGAIIALNVLAVSQERVRFSAALVSGIGHVFLGALHVYRLFSPFTFIVFGYEWSLGASLREVFMVLPFGALCLFVAAKLAVTKKII